MHLAPVNTPRPPLPRAGLTMNGLAKWFDDGWIEMRFEIVRRQDERGRQIQIAGKKRMGGFRPCRWRGGNDHAR